MNIVRMMSVFLTILLIIGMIPVSAMAEGSEEDLIEVEASPKDPSIDPKGPTRKIDLIDEEIEGDNLLALFTTEYGSEVFVRKTTVAVQVDKNNKVLHVASPSIDGQPPNWEDDQYLEIPEGGYVLYATDNSYANQGYKKFLATNFKVGDIIKLRRNGEVIQVTDLMSGEGLRASIRLENPDMYTVTQPTTKLSGSIGNFEPEVSYELLANGREIEISDDGTFAFDYNLEAKTNYIDIELYKNEKLHHEKTLAVFYQIGGQSTDKEVFLWVEQGPNAKGFQTSESIYNTLASAKDAGFTAVALDVKGYEGFASYQKNNLTNRPYISEITNDIRAGANPDLDLLEEFVKHGHSLGLKVHASFNIFAEGSIHHNEFPILDKHLDWEEQVYRPEDGGEILRLRDSQYGKDGAIVAFVNPAHPEARDYQLRSIEEVIQNYDVDGIILDRGRYDNYFADFSDISKSQFEVFLEDKGKKLENWPEDIFRYEGNAKIDGPLINDWYTYRAGVITSFVKEVRELVDSYNAGGKDIQLSTYVGSWYDSYYLNGTNWASPNFEYHETLGFDQASLYTPEYAKQGYTEYLDFLMIGTYQSTASEIKHYITLGNIVTDGDLPLLAGMQLANIPEPAVQREVFQAGLNNTNGLMIFDLIHANFPMLKAGINDYEYVKDFQLGISNPKKPDEIIEGNYVNINRNEGQINVYTDSYGASTNASIWGVEMQVDSSGKVTKTVNKKQAMDWEWKDVQVNNTDIPKGGFVISAEDQSGTRTQRQKVANAYDLGDDVRAAVLSGYLDYDGKTYNKPKIDLEGHVQVIGPGKAEVIVNEEKVQVDQNGDFLTTVVLESGSNEIEIVVYVDGYKTNYRQIEVIGGEFEEEKIDKSKLQEKIDSIKEESLDSEDYTEETWQVLETALKAAEDVLQDSDATQESVDAVLEALVKARDGLEKRVGDIDKVDKSALQDKVDTIEEESLNSGDYTEETWQTFDIAFKKAKEILEDPDVTQAQVDEALKALESSYNGLVKKDEDKDKAKDKNKDKDKGEDKDKGVKKGKGKLPKTGETASTYWTIGAGLLVVGLIIQLAMQRERTQ